MIENSLTTRRSSSFTPYSTLSTNKLWPGCWLLSVWRPSTLPLEVLFMNRCGRGFSSSRSDWPRHTPGASHRLYPGHTEVCRRIGKMYIFFFKRVFSHSFHLPVVFCVKQFHNSSTTKWEMQTRSWVQLTSANRNDVILDDLDTWYPFLQWLRYRYKAYHALVQDSSISSVSNGDTAVLHWATDTILNVEWQWQLKDIDNIMNSRRTLIRTLPCARAPAYILRVFYE